MTLASPDLHAHVDEGFIADRDIEAVGTLMRLAVRENPNAEPTFTDTVWLALSRVLAAFREQHTCVELDEHPDWIDDVRRCTSLVGKPNLSETVSRLPFVLDDHDGTCTLYLHRSWAEEQSVAESLVARAGSKLTVITGGPGTGKTTKVVSDLVERLSRESDSSLVVAMAAPTGKAAKRMTQAIESALDKAQAPEHVRRIVLASPAVTIHSLLGAVPHRRDKRFTYHAGNRLIHDVVIVDETSMVSLSQMHHLLAALRPDAELILVGDPDQLASVDSGTVLADIVDGFGSDRVTVLTEQHRFKGSTGIIDLASAIRDGKTSAVFAALSNTEKSVEWIDPVQSPEQMKQLIDVIVGHAREVMDRAVSGDLAGALAVKGSLQVLCAHRHGRHGVTGWNALVENHLGPSTSNPWYVGRPVIVTVNDRMTKLANGDVGVIGEGDKSRVSCFGTGTDSSRIPVTRLPHVETVHALTIHKSQGSEYDHVIVVLPEQESKILTRELFYTGVTRAAKKLTIVGSKESIEVAVGRKVRRATGLARRLSS